MNDDIREPFSPEPVNEPPVEEPPVNEPPAQEPSIDEPPAGEPEGESVADESESMAPESTGTFERLPEDLKDIHASLANEDTPEDVADVTEGEAGTMDGEAVGAESDTAEETAAESGAEVDSVEGGSEPSSYSEYAGADATAIMTPVAPPVTPDWIDAAPEMAPVASDDGMGGESPTAIPGIDLGPERRSRAWLWILLAVVLITVLGGFGYGWWYTTQRPIPVPKVVGKLPAQAVQSINDAGLRLGKVSEVPTETSLPGTIISQSPLPGARLVPGSSVSIAVAAAPDSAKVPEVLGMTQDDAKVELAKQRLAAFTVDVFDPNIAVGSVSAQVPESGERLAPGSLVVLIISKGTATSQIRVPRVTGLREADAQLVVKAAGLRSQVYRTFDASITAGEVLDQTPAADSFAPYDGFIQYLVSAGPGSTSITMPNIVGTSEKNAKSDLTKLGLKVTVAKVPNAGVAKGNVIAQMPPSGDKVASGASVGLLVSRGSLTSGTVPDIKAMASTDATAAITKAGFVPLKIEIVSSDRTVGTVIGQFPDPQAAWMLRLPVVMVVAKQ